MKVAVNEIEKIASKEFVSKILYVDESIEQNQVIATEGQVRNILYNHFDKDNHLDWQLIEQYNPSIESPATAYGVWGNRVFTTLSFEEPFVFSIGVFEPDTEKNRSLMSIYGEEKYNDLEKVLNELNLGRLIGDVDEDNCISVLDSTYVQKALSGLINFSNNDRIKGQYAETPQFGRAINYISDFNEDGNRDILDATAIQKSIAKLG